MALIAIHGIPNGIPTFESYCKEKWGMNRAYASKLIGAAKVADALYPMGYKPTSERQLRPLTSLTPEEQG